MRVQTLVFVWPETLMHSERGTDFSWESMRVSSRLGRHWVLTLDGLSTTLVLVWPELMIVDESWQSCHESQLSLAGILVWPRPRQFEVRELISHMGLIPKVTPLKLFYGFDWYLGAAKYTTTAIQRYRTQALVHSIGLFTRFLTAEKTVMNAVRQNGVCMGYRYIFLSSGGSGLEP